MGEDKLVALIQESLAVATRMGAAKPADFRQVVIDTTVQEKAIAFPTDAKLMHRARERLVRLRPSGTVTLRQSYVRVGKIALIRHQRYAHAKQFKRATRALRSLRTMLGRIIHDITRKIVGRPELADVLGGPPFEPGRLYEAKALNWLTSSIRLLAHGAGLRAHASPCSHRTETAVS